MSTRSVSQAENVPSTRNEGRRSRKARPTRIAGLAACVALLIASCSSTTEPTTAPSATTTATSSAPTGSALKPIDPTAFQAVVDAAAKELMVPGAMVVLRTPQGIFDAAVGTTKLGAQTPPDANTHFRIASNTKTMTAALIVLLAQDGKLQVQRPGVRLRSRCAQR